MKKSKLVRNLKLISKGLMFALLFFFLSTVYSQEWKTYLEKAIDFERNYFYKKAEFFSNIEKAYELNPDDSDVLYYYSISLYDRRRFKEAEPIAEKAVKLDPKNPDKLAHLAYVYGRLGEENMMEQLSYKSKAVKLINQALKLNPNFEDAYTAWGVGYHYFKNYDAAITCFKKSAELNPKRPWALTLLGRTYLATGKVEEAKEVFKKAIEIAKNDKRKDGIDSRVPRAIALYYEEAGMFKEALEMANLALSWNKKDISTIPEHSIKIVIERLREEIKTGKRIPIDVNDQL